MADVSSNILGTAQTLDQLKAATTYTNWNCTIWDFGTSSQFPGLIIDNCRHRPTSTGTGSDIVFSVIPVCNRLDSDGDGVYDFAFDGRTPIDLEPTDPTKLGDHDNDGEDSIEDLDDDGDTLPDSIDTESFRGISCSLRSDCDNDGTDDITDVDDDGDGLIEIYNLTMLHNMRYDLDGSHYNDNNDPKF